MGGSQSAPEAANPLTNGQDVFPLSGELDEQKRVNDENQFGVKIVRFTSPLHPL